jgi:hypothetical protein
MKKILFFGWMIILFVIDLEDFFVNKNLWVAEMCQFGWRWRRRLFVWEEDQVEEYSAILVNFLLQVNAYITSDLEIKHWRSFTVKRAYNILAPIEIKKIIWNKLTPSEVSLFVWRLLSNRISTNDNLARCEIMGAFV